MTAESVYFRVGDFSCVSLPDVIETLTEVDIENMFTDDAERMLAAFRDLPVPLTSAGIFSLWRPGISGC